MNIPATFSEKYIKHLDATYDCVDRIVLNAYFSMGMSPGGFRTWWRELTGGDETLDDTHLMRFAGRFSRRIQAYANREGIALAHCASKERKHELAEQYKPKDPSYKGVYCILAGRSPAPVYRVIPCNNGQMHIERKKPYPYVNHYSFYIMDPDWGAIVIKICPHPPFTAQIILNGHEYVARQAVKEGISFTKEGNCFTRLSNAADFGRIADAMRTLSSVGRMSQVCERWIYSSCLCFALTLDEQRKSIFRYSYSVYQAEYSRNLIFTRGRTMDEVFQSIIDRSRSPLNIKTIKTIFGYKRRPYHKDKQGKPPKVEAVVERPVYDLTIFKVHLGKLTVKIYSKGERVLRIEAIAHNTNELGCRKSIGSFGEVASALKSLLERFLEVLSGIDCPFLNDETLDKWPLPSMVGATRVGGIDVNKLRIRSAMEAVVALSLRPHGFTTSDLAAKVQQIMDTSDCPYQPRQASYDLKKFRGKGLVRKIEKSRRYEITVNGLRSITGFLFFRHKVLVPLLAGNGKPVSSCQTENQYKLDIHYRKVQIQMQHILNELKIAA